MPNIRIIAAFATLVTAITPATAQDWPTRPVTMVVPFAAGGPLDVVGRLWASRLSQILAYRSTKRYLNIELLKDQQMRGAIIA